jgi:hypothetical protein
VRLGKLPGWITDEVTSVRGEMAAYMNETPEALWRHTADCARDAMWAIRACDIPERALSSSDPVPESTRTALVRLRRIRERA